MATFWRRAFSWLGGNPGRPVEDPESAVIGAPTAAGITVDAATALNMVPVYRAVELISQTIASMPLRIMCYLPDGSRVAEKPPELAAVWRRPNPEESRPEFIGRILRHLLVWGDAFIYVEPSRDGFPDALWLIEPHRVDVGRDQQGSLYFIVDSRSDFVFRPWQLGSTEARIVHLKIGSIDGLRGRGPVMCALESIGLGRAADRYAARYFAAAGVPGGIIYVPQALSPDARQRLRDAWAAAYSGSNAHRVAVIDGGAKWEPTSSKPAEMQLLEARRYFVTEVARLFGIPPHLLADASQSTSWGSGLEEQNRAFVMLTLRPYLSLLETSFTDAFCPGHLVVRIDPSALFQGAWQSRMAAYSQARMAGIMTINEIRDMEDLPSIGEEGDNVLIPLNAAPIAVQPRSEGTIDEQ